MFKARKLNRAIFHSVMGVPEKKLMPKRAPLKRNNSFDNQNDNTAAKEEARKDAALKKMLVARRLLT